MSFVKNKNDVRHLWERKLQELYSLGAFFSSSLLMPRFKMTDADIILNEAQ